MTLNAKCFDEETWLIVPSSENNNDQLNLFQEDEDLDKWLEGAVKKLDFRTRSALSRRLEKKQLKREKKDKMSEHVNTSLVIIEENAKEKHVIENCLNTSSNFLSKKSSTASLNLNNNIAQNSSCSTDCSNFKENASKVSLLTKKSLSSRNINNIANYKINKNQSFNLSPDEKAKKQNAVNNLSKLERKAKEQEEELRKELYNRFLSKDDLLNQHLNIDSASSSPSSSVVNFMAISKSLDFKTPKNSLCSSQSNEGSGNELDRSENYTSTHNFRISLPRRPLISGKTSIPLPTPKYKTLNRQSNDMIKEQISLDDDCF